MAAGYDFRRAIDLGEVIKSQMVLRQNGSGFDDGQASDTVVVMKRLGRFTG